jgi:4-hydroxybenzoate polyprenyltransferase
VAALAGGPLDLALRIGVSMALLQFGIGTVNDIVDAPLDAGRKGGKPIPAGLVPSSGAVILAAVAFGSGVALAAGVSLATAILAVVVIAIGLAYDLRLKGTAWSWLPFAIGIPVLPVFGWVGATGTLDPIFAILLPAAVLAGAALAIANALVDIERDRAAGISSVAIALGQRNASGAAAGLFAAVWSLAWSSALRAGVDGPLVVVIAIVGLVPPASAAWAASASSARRERLWQAEALGLAVLAGLWLIAMLGPGRAGS